MQAPAVEAVPTTDDEQLLLATRDCLEDPPETLVVMTGTGFRGWMEAADGWGIGDELRARLAQCEIIARGAKASGVLRFYGLAESWQPVTEQGDEILSRLLVNGVRDRRIAVQPHGSPMTGFCTRLIDEGAKLVEIPVYRTEATPDQETLLRLISQLCAGTVDAVTFTSTAAVQSLLSSAEAHKCLDELLAALRGPVLAFGVGPVTASPLIQLCVPVIQPERHRLGSLVRAVIEQLPARRAQTVRTGKHRIELRGLVALVDGDPVSLTEQQATLLCALVQAGGNVLTRADLLRAAWPQGITDEHVVEVAVGRLRASLGPASDVIETVIKRGYRLAAEADGVAPQGGHPVS